MRHVMWAALAAALPSSIVHAADPVPGAPAPAAEAPKPKPFKGFRIDSEDKAFGLRIGTQLQIDALFFPADDNKVSVDEVRIRRFRPSIRATLFKHYDVRTLVDFADGTLAVFDAVVETTHLPELRFRFGKDKSPVSYDRLQSSTALTFLERGAPASLAPNRDLGFHVLGTIGEGVFSYQLGVFDGATDGASVDRDSDDRFEVAGRLAFQPFVKSDIAALSQLVIGVSGSFGETLGNTTTTGLPQYRTPGRATWFRYASSTTDPAATALANGDRLRLGAHLDWRVGPFGLWGEYLQSGQEIQLGAVNETVTNSGFEATASIVLTGDESSYKGVDPEAPFDPDTGGAGAFELAARVSQLTIDEAAFDNGFADPAKSAESALSLAFGVNWYLNSGFKLQLQFERTQFEGGAGAAGAIEDREPENFLGARVQWNL